MPDERKHRGAHPEDAELFSAGAVPRLQSAARDLSWLLTNGYASPSALKLVGDRYELCVRQRTAVMRCACTADAAMLRQQRRVSPEELPGKILHIDGYNILTTIEVALAGGVLIRGHDGCLRDMASMHGSFRRVEETLPALALAGQTAAAMNVAGMIWYLDEPVSNSGRLKTLMMSLARERGWIWDVQVVPNPDRVLSSIDGIVATADSVILDLCKQWFGLADEVIERHVPNRWLVRLDMDVAP